MDALHGRVRIVEWNHRRRQKELRRGMHDRVPGRTGAEDAFVEEVVRPGPCGLGQLLTELICRAIARKGAQQEVEVGDGLRVLAKLRDKSARLNSESAVASSGSIFVPIAVSQACRLACRSGVPLPQI